MKTLIAEMRLRVPGSCRNLPKLLALVGAILAVPQLGSAKDLIFTVNSTTDAPDKNPGDGICATAQNVCTLRAAIQEINNNAVGNFADQRLIILPAGTYNLTIPGKNEPDDGRSGDLNIKSYLTIQGAGALVTIIRGAECPTVADASPFIPIPLIGYPAPAGTPPVCDNHDPTVLESTDRILDINSSGVNIRNVTIRRGGGPNGGGIKVEKGSDFVYLENSIVTDNHINRELGLGGGILNEGSLYIRQSTISNNTTYLRQSGGHGVSGGGIANFGFLDIDQSTISGNQANRGGGILNAGDTGGSIIFGSTISTNYAAQGGGIMNVAFGNSLSIFGSTITANQVNVDASIIDGSQAACGTVQFECTYGGGIYNYDPTELPRTSIVNTILAGNIDNRNAIDPKQSADCFAWSPGILYSDGANLVGDLKTTNCNFSPYPNHHPDLLGPVSCSSFIGQCPLQPLLGPLQDNGGPTWTHALLVGSPAINSGTGLGDTLPFACLSIDQRGFARTANCDTGAVQSGASNTPARTNFVVHPVDPVTLSAPVSLTFSAVTQPGATSVMTSSSGAAPPSGFSLGSPPIYYNLSTSATFTGSILVCIDYTGITFKKPPELFHFVGGAWVRVTTSSDATSRLVCGSVTSLSPFALFQQFPAVDISTVMANPGFELGLQPLPPGSQAACPLGWACLGSPSPGGTAYLVTSAQYMANADGLTGGLIVPGGLYAGQCPTLVQGSCQLYQLGLGTYQANTTYTLNLWVGTPLTVPYCGSPTISGCVSNVSPTGKVARVTFYWLGSGNGQLQATDITVPARGQWQLVPLSFTPTGNQVGQPINILIFASTGNGYQIVNFDIVPASLGS
jgi:CSLREA domain-containing protein